MATIYKQRHPETTVLYRVLATHFDTFLTQYEARFQRRYTRYFCPSCHAKRCEAWSIWLGRHLLLRVPHRQVVFTIPKMVRPFFKYQRHLLSDLCLCAVAAISKYLEARRDTHLMPGVVAVIQTFGNRLNFHPHLHMLITEGGTSRDGDFYPVPIFNDAAIARIFAHEVLALLVARDLVSGETASKILSWHHTGFNVHSKVRTTTREQAQRVARYMAKPVLALRRLSFDLAQGKVIYQYGKEDSERVEMDYLDFIARVTTHIPDKGQVMIRYYGLYSNAHRGRQRKRGQATSVLPILMLPPLRRASPGWRELIKKVYEVDPLVCPACGSEMKPIAFITNYETIDKIIHHLQVTFTPARPPPSHQQKQLY